MHAEFIPPDDPRWARLLDRVPHDAYQRPEYAVVAGHHEGGEPVAFYAADGLHVLLIPLLLRELPEELGAGRKWRDATSPYGYAGPIATPGIPLATARCAFAWFRECAREHSLVSAFIRMHPLRSVPIAGIEEHGTVVTHGQIVYSDLSKSLVELWAETRSNHRRNITRLVHLGFRVEMDNWTEYPAFRLLYHNTMQRRSADPFYFFPDAYFDELRERLGNRLHLCIVRAPHGDVAAAGVFMSTDGVVEYHLGATADAHRALAPSKLMFDFVRRWAKAGGAHTFNLGGGVGGTSGSLQQFKTGFSPARADFRTVRLVFDQALYETLTRACQARPPVAAHDAFFPAYRQPRTAGAA